MGNLLQTIGYEKLLADITVSDMLAAREIVPISANIEPLDIIIAYLVGIKQGVHNERARRKEKGGTAL